MGMSTALELKSFDGNLTIGGFTVCKINDITLVGTMRDEISFGVTEGTFFHRKGMILHKNGK